MISILIWVKFPFEPDKNFTFSSLNESNSNHRQVNSFEHERDFHCVRDHQILLYVRAVWINFQYPHLTYYYIFISEMHLSIIRNLIFDAFEMWIILFYWVLADMSLLNLWIFWCWMLVYSSLIIWIINHIIEWTIQMQWSPFRKNPFVKSKTMEKRIINLILMSILSILYCISFDWIELGIHIILRNT